MNTRDIQRQLMISEPTDCIIDLDNELIKCRENEISQIHTQMQEVNELMRSLYQMTQDQASGVDDIANHIAITATYVDEGNKELTKADESLRKSSCQLL